MLLGQYFALIEMARERPVEQRTDPITDRAIAVLPELLDWLASCGHLGTAAERREMLDQAYLHFASHCDEVGLLLTWITAAETYLHEYSGGACIGQWIRRFDEHLGNGLSFPAPDMECRLAANLARLCVMALEHQVEIPYVQELIRRRQIMPETPPVDCEHWPWPLKIHTLGRFGLVRDGVSVRFSGKVQQKPLELLKVLIALGGRNVAEGKLSEELWPNAPADDVHKTFIVTLHRLRRLLGDDRFILYSEGMVTLNPDHCWVDIWAFSRLCGQAKQLLHIEDDPPPPAVHAAKRAVTLYSGHFLPADTASPWAISLRESLRSRIIQLIISLGRHKEEIGNWRKAIDLYLRGLEVDGLGEELYQRLMVCHRNLGDHGAVHSVYHRCRLSLAQYGIKPSSTTKAVYETSVDSRR
jgi:DNA-binding SARP family transcriptional activator